MHRKPVEIKTIFLLILLLFAVFLGYPLIRVLMKSLEVKEGIGIAHYLEMWQSRGFLKSLGNSFLIAGVSALVTTLLAFFMAYTVNQTNVSPLVKKMISLAATLPMLLPTITYGFAIIYSFGKQGLITKILGRQFFEIYGFNGLLIGYVIYTMPVAFLLINNTFRYIDKKFIVVSRIMGDCPVKTFWITIVRPLLGTLAAAFIQTFFLSFTDYGIPAAVGGEFHVVATTLYNEMLGAIPNFQNGAVVAVSMLAPSVVSILVLNYLERYNIRYTKISEVEISKNGLRDFIFGAGSLAVCGAILSIFAVIFVIPFIKGWPYDIAFSFSKFSETINGSNLTMVYKNSIVVAALTACLGTVVAYGAALVTGRSSMPVWVKSAVDGIALTTNTIPGMVLGIAFLFAFSGSSLHNTFLILILCNVVHFFSTPYLMMKGSLEKMNSSWEMTAMLMGDNWFKTIVRVVTPNAGPTILEVFGYYFINGMVTISAVIFIAGARTMVITTKIKELQHFAKFDEIFALSLLILATNLAVKGILKAIPLLVEIKKESKKAVMAADGGNLL